MRFGASALSGLLLAAVLCCLPDLRTAGASHTTIPQSAQRELRLMDSAQAEMHTVCAEAKAGTGFDMVTFAGAAAAQLRSAGMDQAPWNRLPPGQIAFACYASGFSRARGVFVDQQGHRTPAPPVPALKCKRTKSGSECPIPGFGG
jgi:hypothetical protein